MLIDKLKEWSIGLPKYALKGFVEFDVRNVTLRAAADTSVTLFLPRLVKGGMV
jgi:hypothetical protein